jgi:putative hydrolase of the HAD superfamily
VAPGPLVGSRVTYTKTRSSPRVSGHRPRVVVLDLGEVLATPTGLYRVLATRLSLRAEAVEAAYWAHRDAYDRGGDSRAFWRSVLNDVGVPVTDGIVAELTRIDTEAWTTIRPDAQTLLKDLWDVGIRVGILSNASPDIAASARETKWSDYVTDWFFSSELRSAKPDPVIYQHVTNGLGLPAGSIVFIDDRQENVNAALDAGWNAHLWISGTETRALLKGLGLLRSGG